jgi:hypothetical protein
LDLLTPYTFTTRDYRQLQRYLYSTHFTVHHYTRTRILSSLVVSWQRIYHNLVPLLPLFLQLPTQFNSKLISGQAGISNLTLCFFITTLHGLHGKHCLLLSRIVLGVFTAPLHSNGRGEEYIENILLLTRVCLWQLFTESLPSNGYTRRTIIYRENINKQEYQV